MVSLQVFLFFATIANIWCYYFTNIIGYGGISYTLTIIDVQRPEDAVADFVYKYKNIFGESTRYLLNEVCPVLKSTYPQFKQCDDNPPSPIFDIVRFKEFPLPLLANFTLPLRIGYNSEFYTKYLEIVIPIEDSETFVITQLRTKLRAALSGIVKLKSCGFYPSWILDVGAHFGEWANQTRRLFPESILFMIEGNIECTDKLSEVNLEFEISLVGKAAGVVPYYKDHLDTKSTGNSIYKENSKYFVDAMVVPTEINTIDSIASKRSLGAIEYLKLDIQGAELDALMGATEVLKSVQVRLYIV